MEHGGLPKELIEALEAEMDSFTFESVIERMDAVFNKGWSYHFTGPELIEVPVRVPKNPNAKNPRAFVDGTVANWHCSCAIAISTGDITEIIREYAVLVPASESGAFCVARDLSLIYAAYYGLRVGKQSEVVFHDDYQKKVGLIIGPGQDAIETTLQELDNLKTRMGIRRNEDLDPLVEEWSGGELKTYFGITRRNLREFTDFLKTKLK